MVTLGGRGSVVNLGSRGSDSICSVLNLGSRGSVVNLGRDVQ